MELQFTTNQIASTRNETIDGVEFLVAPVVAIRAGELNGEIVTLEEIAAHFHQWNGTPFVIGHPEMDGIDVSANDPEILAAIQIGQLFNVEMDDDKLKGEIWVNLTQAAKVARGPEVINRLQTGKLEVSTAYFRDRVNGAARNIRNDHLAALLDDKGACSWEDGCGAPRANAGAPTVEPEKEVLSILQRIERFLKINQDKETSPMEKLIEQLLAAEGMTLNAEQLGAMDEPTLTALVGMLVKAVVEPEPEADPATNAPESAAPDPTTPVETPEPATNAQPCAQTETLMALAEAVDKRGGVEPFLAEMDKARQQTVDAHADLVGQLVANAQCPIPKEVLTLLPLDALQTMSHSLRPADYTGQHAGAPPVGGFTEQVM